MFSRVPRLVTLSSFCLRRSLNSLKLEPIQFSVSKKRLLTNETINNEPKVGESFQQEEKTETDDGNTIEEIILKSALKHVPEYGFSTEAISRGAIECGLSTATKGIFSNGAFDLIDYFYKSSNAKLSEHLENLVKEGKVKGKNQLIKCALVYRLELTQPYINHWPQAMALMTFNPKYALTSIENLLKLCDDIWHQVGDDSTDLNWYTKRLTLAGVYKSTELFMIQDKSENFKDTYEFLDNRFKDLGNFNKFTTELSNLNQAFTGTFTVLKNIMNLRN